MICRADNRQFFSCAGSIDVSQHQILHRTLSKEANTNFHQNTRQNNHLSIKLRPLPAETEATPTLAWKRRFWTQKLGPKFLHLLISSK